MRDRYENSKIQQATEQFNRFQSFQPQLPSAPECSAAKTVAFSLLDDCLNTDYAVFKVSGVDMASVADENTHYLVGENATKITGTGLCIGTIQFSAALRTYSAGSYLNIQPYDFFTVRFYLPATKTAGDSNTGDLTSIYLKMYDVNNYTRTYMLWLNHTAQKSGWNVWCGTKLGYDSESNAAFDETQIASVYFMFGQASCVYFTGGSVEPTVYQYIYGNTSTATMTLSEVVVLSGSFAAGDAAGYFYGLTAGTFTKAETFSIKDNSNASVVSANAGTLPYTQIAFTSGGTYEMQVGDEVTGATSNATGTIAAILNRGGTYGAGTATGQIFLSASTGTFQAENLNVGANSNVATIPNADDTVSKILTGVKNELVIDSIKYESGYDVPGVILRIDDGYTEAYAVASYLASQGLRACFAIVPDEVGSAGHLTWDQIYDIQRMGHDIISHAWAHSLYDRASATTAIASVMRARDTLFNNGFPNAGQVLVPAQGRWSTLVEETIGPYAPLLLTCYNEGSRVQALYTGTNPSRLPGLAVDDTSGELSSSASIGKNSTAPKTVEKACRDAIAQRAHICFYWHKPTGAGLTRFKADIVIIKKYLDGGSLKLYSVFDILRGNYPKAKLGRIDDADGKTVAAWENEYINYMNGAGTWTLPKASTVLGKTFWFIKTTADDTNITPDAGDTISYGGCAAGDKLLGTGAAGDQVRLTAVDADTWMVSSMIGAWTDNN
jgi:hypothetical protein